VIDLHAHVLPGVDDGARDEAEALEMLRLAAADGTTTICATPHSHGPELDVPRATAVATWERLREKAREAGIPIELRLASEVWYRSDLAEMARDGRLAGFSASGRKYVLVEFPPTHVPTDAKDVFFRLRLEGITPVLAHPERNAGLWEAPEVVEAFRAQGALVQVTTGSFTGLFRRESRDSARELLRRGAVDLVASDCHRRDRRPPGLADAAREVARVVGRRGQDVAERLTVGVPEAILAGVAAPGAA
jgi:protein-tyrosine phosphatase